MKPFERLRERRYKDTLNSINTTLWTFEWQAQSNALVYYITIQSTQLQSSAQKSKYLTTQYLHWNTMYYTTMQNINNTILPGLRNMNPITTGGRIFSIIYLLFTSYYLFFITYLSAEIFRRFMMAIFPKLAERRYKKKFLLLRLFILIVIASIAFIFIPAAVIQSIEPWTYLESMYFCFVYLITLGFSDYMPGDLGR